jgi:hypothetical protein
MPSAWLKVMLAVAAEVARLALPSNAQDRWEKPTESDTREISVMSTAASGWLGAVSSAYTGALHIKEKSMQASTRHIPILLLMIFMQNTLNGRKFVFIIVIWLCFVKRKVTLTAGEAL